MKVTKTKKFVITKHNPFTGASYNRVEHNTNYSRVNNNWYRHSDLEAVAGVVPDGKGNWMLDNIRQRHLDMFTEDSKGFFSI